MGSITAQAAAGTAKQQQGEGVHLFLLFLYTKFFLVQRREGGGVCESCSLEGRWVYWVHWGVADVLLLHVCCTLKQLFTRAVAFACARESCV